MHNHPFAHESLSASASNINSYLISTSTINMTGIGNGVGNHIYGVDDDTTTVLSNSMSSVVDASNVDTRRSRHSSKTSKESGSSDDTDTPGVSTSCMNINPSATMMTL